MSRETWTTTMFGIYLDMNDIKKLTKEVKPVTKQVPVHDRRTGAKAGFESETVPGYRVLVETKLDFNDPANIEEAFQQMFGMDVCAHFADSAVEGIGIGYQIQDNVSGDVLIEAIKRTIRLIDKCKVLEFHNFSKKPKVLTMENSDS